MALRPLSGRTAALLTMTALCAVLSGGGTAQGGHADHADHADPADPSDRGDCPGYEGDDRPQVVGTDGPDVLVVPEGGVGCGLGGDDKLRADSHGGTLLFGGEGDDIFCARNNDDDRLSGGPGHDKALIDEDRDKLNNVEEDTVVVACRNPASVRY